MLRAEHAGAVLTLQRAAYVTEAQTHRDVDLPPLRQLLSELTGDPSDPEVLDAGWRDEAGRLVATVRSRAGPPERADRGGGRSAHVPVRQGQGLGSSLLTAVEWQLPASVTEVRLFTGERGVGNLRLYERLGYSETHRQATPAGYALVHFTRYRDRQLASS
ncbi:MAG: GNAT family N-acetyltransferase [Jatrophihabitans sp.]